MCHYLCNTLQLSTERKKGHPIWLFSFHSSSCTGRRKWYNGLQLLTVVIWTLLWVTIHKKKVLVKSKVCKSQKLSTNSSTRLALVLSSNSSGENRWCFAAEQDSYSTTIINNNDNNNNNNDVCLCVSERSFFPDFFEIAIEFSFPICVLV